MRSLRVPAAEDLIVPVDDEPCGKALAGDAVAMLEAMEKSDVQLKSPG